MLKAVYFIFGTCIALIVVLLIASTLPVTGNFKVLIVQSGSMQPSIQTGGIVVVKPMESYAVGDVITFAAGAGDKRTVTHRIAEVKEENGRTTFVTKGDANDGKDSQEVPLSRVIGKVLFDIPYLGYAVAAAKTPYGFIFLIVVPATIIIFDEVKKIIYEIKKIRKKDPAGGAEPEEA